MQVQDKSIAELENRFELIKTEIASQPFNDKVFFKENDDGDIDVADILAILNLFNMDRYNGLSSFPITSYNGKKRCIDYYIEEHKKNDETDLNPYVKMTPIMNNIFRLYDQLEVNIGNYYREKNPSGKYGSVKGVAVRKNGDPFTSKFYDQPMDYLTPNGFIYPILGAFRALVEEKEGYYQWKKNPFDILTKIGPELVETTIERSRTLGNNPNAVGRDGGNWKTLYMSVMFEIMSE